MRGLSQAALLAPAILLLLSCSSLATAPIDGTYALESIGGAALPTSIGGQALIIVSQVVDLKSRGIAQTTEVFRVVTDGSGGPPQTTVLDGSWERDGNTVVVTTSRDRTKYVIEDHGRTLRSVERTFFGASLDVLYEYVLTRRR